MFSSPIFKRIVTNGFFATLFTSLIKLTSFFKVSFIIGTYTAFFSMTSIMMPLSGSFGGISGALAVGALGLGLRLFLVGFISFTHLAYHIPGLFAALYWTTRSPLIRIVLPLTCMLAFIAHPVGQIAWCYSLYWLIPVGLYLFKGKSLNNLFFEALGSTFIAHAVGSVIWIYAMPMTPQVWLALMPVVIVERLVFASGMVLMHKVISYAISMWKSRVSLFQAFFVSHKN